MLLKWNRIKKDNKQETIKNLLVSSLLFLFLESYKLASFDKFAFTETNYLKYEFLQLMDLAEEPFSTHEKKVEELQNRLALLIDYEKLRENNRLSIEFWDQLANQNSNLLSSFFSSWKREEKLSAIYIIEFKKLIGMAFDMIVDLESKK